jgi:thymidine phosphorylase
MASDITSKEDIHEIITQFYEQLLADVQMKAFLNLFC